MGCYKLSVSEIKVLGMDGWPIYKSSTCSHAHFVQCIQVTISSNQSHRSRSPCRWSTWSPSTFFKGVLCYAMHSFGSNQRYIPFTRRRRDCPSSLEIEAFMPTHIIRLEEDHWLSRRWSIMLYYRQYIYIIFFGQTISSSHLWSKLLGSV